MPVAAAEESKHTLARAVLVELGVAGRFDRYVTQGADRASGDVATNAKLREWHRQLWIQELGWKKVEEAYISHFESRFSDSELRELLQMAKNPVLKKFIKEELQAYSATTDRRNELFAEFWRRLNMMEFEPPAEVYEK